MKKAMLVLVLSIFIFSGCTNNSSTDATIIPVVPQFGFGSIESGRVSVDINSDAARAEVLYFNICPLLTGFDMENSQSLTEDDSYTMTIMGKEITTSVSKLEDGRYQFIGELEDGTGDITILYNPADNTFSYTQFFVMSMKVSNYDNNPDQADIEYANYAIYNKSDSIVLNEDGSFSGRIYSYHLSQYDSVDEGDSTLELIGSSIAELYRGELSPSLGTGIGAALLMNHDESTTFEDSVYLGGSDAYVAPTAAQITEMRDYLEDYVSANALDDVSGYPISDDGSMIIYHVESSGSFVEAAGADLANSADLATWKANTILDL